MTYKKEKQQVHAVIKDAYGTEIEGQLKLHLPTKPGLGNFIRAFEQGCMFMASSGLHEAEHRMAWYLIGVANWENECWVDRVNCQMHTNILPKNQKRAIDVLVAKGIISPSRKINAQQLWVLNPRICFKGDALRYADMVRNDAITRFLINQHGEAV